MVDIGNSHTVTGMYEDNKLIGQWRLNSNVKSTSDELAIRYHALFNMAGIDKSNIKGIIIASVVPILQSAWLVCCKKHFSDYLEQDIFVVQVDKLKELITVLLDNPNEVGADRLVNAIAAYNLNNCKQVVIDFGTAITFDCLTEECEYLGGTILPGIAISLEALASKTANLPHIDVSDPPLSVIGKSTVQAMKSGILFGYGGMIDGLVENIKKQMTSRPEEEFKVVATGGMAKLVAPYATTIDLIEPMLTLQGLEYIYNHSVKQVKE